MGKYNIPKILIAILEDKVKAVIGESAIAELRAPVAEAELQAKLEAAAQRADERWLATCDDHEACDAVQQRLLTDSSVAQSAIRQIYDDPNTPLAIETLRAQMTALVPAKLGPARIEHAFATYFECLRVELIGIDGLREKLIGLTQFRTEWNTTRIERNTAFSAEELSRIRELLEGLFLFVSAPPNPDGKLHTPSAEELVRLEAHYRRTLTDSFKNLDFKGLTTSVRPMLLPLEKVYVQLRAVAEVPEAADEFTPEERRWLRHIEEREAKGLDGDEKQLAAETRELYLRLDAARRERWSRERLERFSIVDSLKNPDRRGLVILGDPGSGKTTLLHFAALIFAQGPDAATQHFGLTGDEADRLPIFAPLAFYDDMLTRVNPDLTIGDFLGLYYEKRCEMPGLAPLFQQAIDSGRALVLLDGLDEVIDEDRRKFVAGQASAFIRRVITRGNRVLLTSRIYGYRSAPLSVDLPHVTVLDFRREEIELFARQWNEAIAEWEYGDRLPEQQLRLARESEQNLLDEIESNPGVERLAANPLLLSMLSLLRRQVGRLPQQRIRLYTMYLSALIDVWETNRTPGGRVSAPARLDSTKAELVLIPLALWLQQHRGSGTATRADIVAEIANEYLRQEGFEPQKRKPVIPPDKQREAEERADKFLEDMRQFSGLLVDRGQNAFGFRHLTFQEYFAGRGLARMTATERWKLIRPNLHTNRWREPILLAAAQLGTMQTDGKTATALVKKILTAQNAHESSLHRDLFLAADCAADDINVDLPVLRQLVKELGALTHSPIPALASEAVRHLVNLAKLTSGNKPRLPETIEALQLAILPASGGIGLKTYVNLTASLYANHPGLRATITAKLADKDWNMRAAAIGALAGLVGGEPELCAALTPKLADESSNVRAAAVRALAGVVGSEPEVRATLTAKLADEHYDVRAAAIGALGSLVGSEPEVRAALIPTLADEHYYVRTAAIGALASLVSTEPEVRAALTSKLDDANDPFGYVCAAAIGALAGLVSSEPEVRAAIIAKLPDEFSSVRAAAIQALADLVGSEPEVRAALTLTLDDEDNDVRAAAIRALIELDGYHDSIGALVKHLDWRTRKDTLVAFTEKRTTWGEVSQLLHDLKCMEASLGRAAAIGALAGLVGSEPEVRATITAKLADEDIDVRAAAIGALAGLVGSEPEVHAALTLTLVDEHPNVRAAAIGALASLVGSEPEVRATITAKLADDDIDVRAAAIGALAGLVGSEPEVRAALIPTLDDEHYYVRTAAIGALAGLVGSEPEVRAALIPTLDDEHYYVRTAAIGALAGLVGSDPEVHAALTPTLDDANDPFGYVRAAAIGALAGLVSSEPKVCAALTAKLADESWNVRTAAIGALASVVGSNDELRAALTAKLADKAAIVRAAAIEALAGLVGSEPEVRAALTAKLADESWNVRAAAIEALADLVGSEPEVRAALTAKLDDADDPIGYVRAAAIGTLAGLVSSEPEVCAALTAKLADESWNVRAAAIEALADLVDSEPEVRAALTTKLADKDTDVRAAAIHALAHLAPHDSAMRGRLAPALQSDDQEQQIASVTPDIPRTAVVEGFGQWLARDPAAWTEVVKMLSSEDWRLRLSGIEIVMVAGEAAVRQVVPRLLAAVDDHRGLDSWPARITAAELLLNDQRHSQEAIDTILPALDYGANPLVDVPNATEIRQQSALALGKLKAEFRRPDVAEKLEVLLVTEKDPKVLDSLFNALGSLAAAPEEDGQRI